MPRVIPVPTYILDELVLENVRVFRVKVTGWYEFSYAGQQARDIKYLEKGSIVPWPDDSTRIRRKI